MRKPILSLVILFFSSMFIYAVVPSTSFDIDERYRSPARFVEIEESTPFSFEINARSDMDGLMFLVDPASTLAKSKRDLADAIINASDEYLVSNYDEIRSAFSFDANFPGTYKTDAETAYFIREYFQADGGFWNIGDANTAIAMQSLVSMDSLLLSNASLGNGLGFDLKFNGGSIHNGFGWNWVAGISFIGTEELLSQYKYGDYFYGNDIQISFGVDVGYASYVLGDFLSIGISASPRIFFNTSFSSSDYLAARLDADILSLVANNRYNLGVGISLNLGLMYRINDSIALVFDLRDLPTLSTAWYFDGTDIVDGFRFHYDKNLFFAPPDAAFSLLLDFDELHFVIEVGDAVNQAVWMNMVTGYEYDLWIIPKLTVAYDINEELTVSAKIRYRTFQVALDYKGFEVALSSRLDKASFAVKLGYTV